MLAEGFDIYGHKHEEKNTFLEIPLFSCYFSRQLIFFDSYSLPVDHLHGGAGIVTFIFTSA